MSRECRTSAASSPPARARARRASSKWPGRAGPAPKSSGIRRSAWPRSRSSEARPASPVSRLSGGHLQRGAEPILGDGQEPRPVGPPRRRALGGKEAGGEQTEARHRESLGATERCPRRRIDVAPVGPGPGVEQDAGDHEVDPGSRPLVGVEPVEGARQIGEAGGPSGVEVAPATVRRDDAVRIPLAGDGGHQIGSRVEPGQVDREVLETAGEPARQHRAGALADRLGTPEIVERGRDRRGGRHCKPRPLGLASSRGSGTSPFVK